ncbi:MAG TPA: glycosyl hydrolase, partial [Candidatus Nanopelagicales bacterium]
MRRLSMALAATASAGLLAATIPATAASAAPSDPLFGQHIAGIARGLPAGLPSVGAVRLWDAGVSWKDLEPGPDAYNWAPLQAAVANARALGASEILYTMGNTPAWAASDPNSSEALYGRGTNSHPRSNADYVDFVDDMLAAVPGITAVQIWNEANLKDFYKGTPAQIAQLTKEVAPVIRARGAKVVAASTTVRPAGPVGRFGKAYGAAMRKAGAWKSVDVVTGHFYPPATKGPNERVKYIKKIKSYFKKYGAKKKPLWDTEMNFGDTRGYMRVKRQYTGDTAATYVARAYLDARRYGVQRVFWYGWDIHVLGTDMTSRGSGAVDAGGQGFLSIQEWLAGQGWGGCKVKAAVTTCKVGGGTIRYAVSKPRTITLP